MLSWAQTFLLWQAQPLLAGEGWGGTVAVTAFLLYRDTQTQPVLLHSQGSDEEEEGVTDTCHEKSKDSNNISSQV